MNIQTLFYKIGASNLEFKQRVDESKGKLGEFQQKTQENIRTLRNWSAAAGAAATAVVYAVGRMVSTTNQQASQIAKYSEQTGIAVEKMQALGYAAKQNNSTLETLGSSLVRMTRRLEAAHQGNQTYTNSYASMGVKIHDTNGKLRATEDVFLDLADAFARSNDENKKAQVAFDVLGDSGYDLIPLLNQGRGEIIRLAEEANKLGIVLSRENITKFAQYDQQLVKFRESMNGVKMQIATTVVPIFTLFTEKANDGIEKLREWVKEHPETAAKIVILSSAVVGLGLALGGIALAMTIAGKGILVLRGLIGLLNNPIVWLIALGLVLYTAWDENWGGIQDIVMGAVDYILRKWDELTAWWENTKLYQSLRDWWTEVRRIWTEESDKGFGEKVIETIGLTPGLKWLPGFIKELQEIWDKDKTELTFGEKAVKTIELIANKLRLRFGDSAIIDAAEIALKAVVEAGGKLYDAIKKGLDTGDWSDFWSVSADIWRTGVVIGITLSTVIKGAAAALNAIRLALGLLPVAGAALSGRGGLIGLLSIGIALMEAHGEGSYKKFAQNVLVAALTAAIAGAVFGPGGALVGFNLALNLKLGENIIEELSPTFEWLAYNLGKIYERKWNELKGYDEFLRERAAEAEKEMLAASNLDHAEKWVREYDPGQERWDELAATSADVWDVDLAQLRARLGLDEGIPETTQPTVTQTPETPEAPVTQTPTPTYGGDLRERYGDQVIDELLDEYRMAWLKEQSVLMRINPLAGFWAPGINDEGFRRYVAEQLDSGQLEEKQRELKATTEDAAEGIGELGEELTKLDIQAKIIAEALNQGANQEQIMAILGIGYWETRGQGGWAHTDAEGNVTRGAAGEYGLGQVMPNTGRDVWERLWNLPGETYDESILQDIDTNIEMMVSYFLDRYRVHGGDLRKGIEGYNRGTAIDGMQAYTNGVMAWIEGPDGQAMKAALEQGLTAALDAWIEAGYGSENDIRELGIFIAQALADYLVGESPPKKGPLRYIDVGMKNTMRAGIEGAKEGLEEGTVVLTLAAKQVGESAKLGLLEGLQAGQQIRLTPDGVELIDGEQLAEESFGEDSPFYKKVFEKVRQLLSVLGDTMLETLYKQFPELAPWMEGIINSLEQDIQLIFGEGGLLDPATTKVNQLTELTDQWVKSLAQGLADAITSGKGLKETFSDVKNTLSNFLRMIASQFIQARLLMPLFDKIGLSTALSNLPIFHSGGLVLSPAAYYHDGGLIGNLRSDEVPIIAQTGERILSRAQNAAFETLLAENAAGGGGIQIDKLEIRANDAKSFADMLMNNPDAITYIVGNNILNNGQLRQLLKGI